MPKSLLEVTQELLRLKTNMIYSKLMLFQSLTFLQYYSSCAVSHLLQIANQAQN